MYSYKTTFLILVSLFLLAAEAKSNDKSEHDLSFSNLSGNDLRLLLGIGQEDWQPPLPRIALLLEKKKYSQADAIIDKWLIDDFFLAMKSLPKFENFIYRYNDHNVTTRFARSLNRYEPKRRVHILSMLDLKNAAIQATGVEVFRFWWLEDPQGMLAWLATSSGFFEDVYLESIPEVILKDKSDYIQLADLYFGRPDDDERKTRYFTQVIEHWIERDFEETTEYLLQLKNKQGDATVSLTLDRGMMVIVYRLAAEQDYSSALNWAQNISSIYTRDWLVRDISLNAESSEEISFFKQWIHKNPFTHEAAQAQVETYFETLSAQFEKLNND